MRILAPAGLFVFLSSTAVAGHIYGTLRQGGKPLPAGQKVELLQCGDVKPAQTDHNGAYRLFVKATGKCQLVVTFNGRYTGEVFSYPQPTAYDFDLPSDGSQQLKRR